MNFDDTLTAFKVMPSSAASLQGQEGEEGVGVGVVSRGRRRR